MRIRAAQRPGVRRAQAASRARRVEVPVHGAGGSALLKKSLGTHRCDDSGTLRNALLERAQIREVFQVELDAISPASHGEQVRICHGKVLASEVLAVLQ